MESARKAVVETYIEGFRRKDHDMILSCLTDDVLWELHGYTTIKGKAAFEAEIENDAFEGKPALSIDRLVEESDTVVAIGGGSARMKTGETLRFLFSDVFTFSGDLICRLETYQVNLS